MNIENMMSEIRELNLSYLILTQQMIRADKEAAIFRLGISIDIAELLESLSNAQLLKLASTNMMLARFRFEDDIILGMLTDYSKDGAQAKSHAAILMSSQPVEQIS
ncbi:flagellar transcriptional regulator FlhD [Oxalobacter vibrioformis]|uniref:Flagellar transcriptional regulator FlhD n=1 Tax=Oxalobacter vibrioformis TaxID=933080 RepID=A0A9E9LUP0_9BURK|nr:flagellar transcriptional regulator FlhD [Oxalobacter vibrioformis]WAW09501.1 flagellar transcriptional regulator FlhD [Oxalobacter vibrioformis]